MGREEEVEGERGGKGEAGLDLDICPGALKFLVTPLNALALFNRYLFTC